MNCRGLLLLTTLTLCGCAAVSPYVAEHVAPLAPATPAPIPGEPDAYNYLPTVIGGECSEAEYPLFAALNTQPLAETRPLLKTLGIIRDHHLTPMPGGMADEGWMNAINGRDRLRWREEFATADGSRIAWLFVSSHGGGNQGAQMPAIALLTFADYRVVTFQPILLLRIREAFAIKNAAAKTLDLEITHYYQYPTDHLQFTANSIHLAAVAAAFAHNATHAAAE